MPTEPKYTLTVRFKNCEACPCPKPNAYVNSEHITAGWTAIRGEPVTVSGPYKPDHTWICGTDVVFQIADDRIRRSVARAAKFRTAAGKWVCRHVLEIGD